jgi:hypothetical protein
MTTHMIRLWCEPPKGNAQNAVQNWVDNYSEWAGDATEHGMTERQVSPEDDTRVVVGMWGFVNQGEDATDILTRLRDRLSGFQGGLWHRAVYHIYTHDEDNPEPCSWEYGTEYGDVPTGVPDVPEGATVV